MSHKQRVPRRVVTGLTSDGRSTVADDGPCLAHIARPGGATVTEIWRADQLPADPKAKGPLSDAEVLSPTGAGVAVRVCTFPPDDAVDDEAQASYARSLARSYGEQAVERAEVIPGMHRTDTVDVVTVVSGELSVMLESGETTLRPGDSIVQRGTAHAWRNRTDAPVMVVAVMMGAADGEGL